MDSQPHLFNLPQTSDPEDLLYPKLYFLSFFAQSCTDRHYFFQLMLHLYEGPVKGHITEDKRRIKPSTRQELNPRPQKFCSGGVWFATVLPPLPKIYFISVLNGTGSKAVCFNYKEAGLRLLAKSK